MSVLITSPEATGEFGRVTIAYQSLFIAYMKRTGLSYQTVETQHLGGFTLSFRAMEITMLSSRHNRGLGDGQGIII